jgi:hypothetical protein
MSEGRNVTIGQDASGNVIITGDNGLAFILPGVSSLSPETLAALSGGRIAPAAIAEALPLPALTLAIAFADDARTQWRITASRATGDPVPPDLAVPWRDDPALEPALGAFWQLSRERIEKPEDAARLDAATLHPRSSSSRARTTAFSDSLGS